jgi:hypothetical protein
MSSWDWDSDTNFDRKVSAAAGDTIADAIRDPWSAWLTILLTLTAETVAVAACLIAAEKIVKFLDEDENSIYFVAGAPFAIGFLFAFAVGRLLQLKFRSPETAWLRSGFLLWTSALAGGLVNLIALYLVYSYSLSEGY